jgi:WD40 repeat protein
VATDNGNLFHQHSIAVRISADLIFLKLVRQHTDGTHAVTILSDPAAWISDPVSCDNDRWIALNWMVHGERSGNGIWRANSDGSDAVPLTSKEFGSLWGCSPDGKWLYYSEQTIRRHKTATGAALLAGLLIVVAAAYGVYALLRRPAATPFQSFSITPLTNTGKVQDAAISPDGRFLLTVQSDNGSESLWLRNIPTGSNTQVLPASGQSFASLVFSPDGNSFYFRQTEGSATAFNLFRAPLLGGSPALLAKDVDGGPITWRHNIRPRDVLGDLLVSAIPH